MPEQFVPRAEHVWVTDIKGLDAQDQPGLLLGWRRDRMGRWYGWVVSATAGIEAHGQGPYVRQGWVPAASIVRVHG